RRAPARHPTRGPPGDPVAPAGPPIAAGHRPPPSGASTRAACLPAVRGRDRSAAAGGRDPERCGATSARPGGRPGSRPGRRGRPGWGRSRGRIQRVLRWLTAGESHGPALVAILEGLPAGVRVTTGEVAD